MKTWFWKHYMCLCKNMVDIYTDGYKMTFDMEYPKRIGTQRIVTNRLLLWRKRWRHASEEFCRSLGFNV